MNVGKVSWGILLIFLLLCSAAAASASIPISDPFSLSLSNPMQSVEKGSRFRTGIEITVPKGYYLYADELDVEFLSLEGVHVDDIEYPDPIKKKDPLTGRMVPVYDKNTSITILGHVPEALNLGRRELLARVSYQGCSSQLCFRPQEREMTLSIDVVQQGSLPTVESQPSAAHGGGFSSLLEATDFRHILDRGMIWTVLVVLLAGILTSLTPCIWPILPVMMVVIGVERQRSFLRNFMLAVSLVTGLVLVFAVLGVVSAALGKNLGFIFQQRWFIALVVLFFIAMSLSLFGVFEVHLSAKWAHRMHSLGGEGFRGAFLSGMGMGLIASPCSGPVIAVLMGYVALQKSYLMGFALFVVYGLGMGIIIVLLGAAYGVLADRLRSGSWMLWIKRALGVVLLLPAAFYLGSLIHPTGTKIFESKTAVEWIDNAEKGITLAGQTGRPVMLDFYANWCAPCRKLDRKFFSRDDIIKLTHDLVPVRVDVTYETEEVRRLIERYMVMGMPTFVFLSSEGGEYEDLTVSSSNECLLERNMREAVRRSSKNLGGAVVEDECATEEETR